MSLYTDASLIMYPSGYKEDKIYSLKPTDGSGDLTFTRASTATRVNSDGLIEGVRTNTFLYSEDFSDATWVKERISVSSNVTTAPDGTSTADKIVENTDNNSHRARQNANSTQNVEYTLSYYLKASERTKARIVAGGLNASADFDLSTGLIIGSPTLCTASIVSAGNGWYRCAITYTQTSATSAIQLHLVAILNGAGDFVYTGNGTSGVFVWGAQLEASVSATDYIPTTSAAVSVGMLADVPRIDYTGGGCGKLLLESQRTNLATYSEQFDNAAWTKNTGVSVVANQYTSPDGYVNADKLVGATGTDRTTLTLIRSFTGLSSSTAYTASLYIYKDNATQATMYIRDASTGVIVSESVTLVAGWQRITKTMTTGAVTNAVNWYLGNTDGDVGIWGAQLELGSYVSSYIPTLASSVTRLADLASKTGISSLIGQTEGTLFIDVDLTSRGGNTYFAIAPNILATAAYIGIGFTSTRIVFEVVNSGLQANIINFNSATGRFKIAAVYKENDFALYVNGVQIGTDNSGTVPACSQLGLFAYAQTQTVIYNSAILFPTRLSNTDLAALTTL